MPQADVSFIPEFEKYDRRSTQDPRFWYRPTMGQQRLERLRFPWFERRLPPRPCAWPARTRASSASRSGSGRDVRRDSSRGGHDFHRFIDPEDLARMLRRHRARITHMSGIRWSPRLEFTRSTRVSYLGLARLAG